MKTKCQIEMRPLIYAMEVSNGASLFTWELYVGKNQPKTRVAYLDVSMDFSNCQTTEVNIFLFFLYDYTACQCFNP